jgi:carbonic anhydrase
MANSDQDYSEVTRRRFLGTAGGTGMLAARVAAGGLAGATVAGSLLAGPAGTAAASTLAADPHQTLTDLMTGNQRWVTGNPEHPHQSVQRRRELAGGQHPPSVVFSCIDSRVPPELVFDVGLGDMFVTRTGAQTLDAVVLGSIEFGPVKFPVTRLIFVLGHSGCGAIKTAIEVIRDGAPDPPHLRAVVDALRPAYAVAVREPGDLQNNMTLAQTRLTVERLKQDALLKDLIDHDGLLIVGGHYQLESGLVTRII